MAGRSFAGDRDLIKRLHELSREGKTGREIAAETGVCMGTLSKYRAMGLVERKGGGKYGSTAAARVAQFEAGCGETGLRIDGTPERDHSPAFDDDGDWPVGATSVCKIVSLYVGEYLSCELDGNNIKIKIPEFSAECSAFDAVVILGKIRDTAQEIIRAINKRRRPNG